MKLASNFKDPLFQKLLVGNHIFPGYWRYLMPADFGNMSFPQERCSTCMNCPKVKEEGWRKDYRCCTYHPRVSNFALGLALSTEAGRVGFDRAKRRGMLTPEGTTHSPQQYHDYLNDLEEDKFGRSQNVLCPMLDEETGYCNIHAFRNSVCSTFFCLKDHGEKGDNFWSALQVLGSQLEIALSQWCLSEIGFDLESYTSRYNQLGSDIGSVSGKAGGFSEEALKALWGEWYGREEELYLESAGLVSKYRDVLFEIASEFGICEAKDYDFAVLKSVPGRLAHQIDEEEWDQDGEAISPADLWRTCRKRYEKVWSWSKKPLQLNSKAQIREAYSQEFGDNCSHVVEMFETKSRKKTDFKVPLTATEAEFLLRFNGKSLRADWRMLAEYKDSLPYLRRLLAEVCGRRVLVPRRSQSGL